jgi:putative tryptophan/tyrosine transport system substrate-binding protein
MKAPRTLQTVALGLCILLGPLGSEGQQVVRVYRVAVLANTNSALHARSAEAFREGMRELGWIEGQNVAIQYGWADGNLDRLPALASELIRVTPDVMVVAGPVGVRAALQATSSVPIVAAIMGDPVLTGVAASLARPGGRVTGSAAQFEDLVTKQLQILKEMVPKVVRVAILAHTTSAVNPNAVNPNLKAAEAAARALGLKGRVFEIRTAPDVEGAFQKARAERAGAVLVLPSPAFSGQRQRLAELATKHRLPAIDEDKGYVDAGGLISYGPNFPDLYRRAATYVDRILKGARPSDLPIEQPTVFELAINLKAAKALGLAIPQSLLLRTDHVIE